MTTTVNASAESLRRRLADRLRAAGVLGDAWYQAFADVPREHFVPQFAVRTAAGMTGYGAADPDFLETVYSDVPLITHRDRHGQAVNSLTRPRVMAAMLEALGPTDGTVLEVGTGTGYSAALLTHRLGEAAVVSVDIDPGLVDAARQRLAALGRRPLLAVGDGTLGYPGRAPFGGLVATCPLPRIPATWLAQVRPGARIVANLGPGVVALTVGTDGTASGRCLPFADATDDMKRFLGRLFQPADLPLDLLARWAQAGHPGPVAYGLTVHRNGQHELWLGEGPRWPLP